MNEQETISNVICLRCRQSITDAEAVCPCLFPPHMKSFIIGGTRFTVVDHIDERR